MERQPGIYYVFDDDKPCTDCKFYYQTIWRALRRESPLCARTMEWYGEEVGLTRYSKPDPFYMTYCAVERGKNGWLDSCSDKGIYWVPKYKKDLFKLLGDTHEL